MRMRCRALACPAAAASRPLPLLVLVQGRRGFALGVSATTPARALATARASEGAARGPAAAPAGVPGAPAAGPGAGPAPGWREELLSHSVGSAAAAEDLIKLVLRGRVGEGMPYRQATLRPVAVKGRRMLQLSLLDARQVGAAGVGRGQAVSGGSVGFWNVCRGPLPRDITVPTHGAQRLFAALACAAGAAAAWPRPGGAQAPRAALRAAAAGAAPRRAAPPQDMTKNYSQEEAAEALSLLLQLPWTSASLQSGAGGSIAVQVTRRGRALVQRGGVPRGGGGSPKGGAPAPPALRHDRRKALPVPGDVLDPFLVKIGLQTEEGRVRASMQVSLERGGRRAGWVWGKGQ
jgi:hypothetical protein